MRETSPRRDAFGEKLEASLTGTIGLHLPRASASLAGAGKRLPAVAIGFAIL